MNKSSNRAKPFTLPFSKEQAAAAIHSLSADDVKLYAKLDVTPSATELPEKYLWRRATLRDYLTNVLDQHIQELLEMNPEAFKEAA
ncbi:hypothetical protein GA076_19105 [Vibrio parahaemolyticus]|nr:hypothetical protein [Vibrio parahaemolyticus]EGU9030370.1 hypothetical protein [Vibrio parahaemolyticus]EHR0760552.1 hypothetical protein [Vibrio parahaemolyticus]EHR0831259.1 hypothetical protein [Vibrio parahaemolyticus]EHR1158872.1 hypothetical protein [Vibrio parahaemolyticus]